MPAAATLPLFWSPDPKSSATDTYTGFRGTFTLTSAATVEFKLFGAAWFSGWVDGEWFCEGPARYPHAFP